MIMFLILLLATVAGIIGAAMRNKRGKLSSDEFGPLGIFLTWFIVGGLVINGLFYLFSSAVAEGNVRHADIRPLASISKLTGAVKPYYLGSNYENGDRIISYIDNGKGITVLSNVTEQDDVFKVFYRSGKPQVNVVTYSSDYWIVSPFPLLPKGEITYEFSVPKGTVLEGFGLPTN